MKGVSIKVIVDQVKDLRFDYVDSGLSSPDSSWRRSEHFFSWNRLFSIRSGEAEFDYNGCTFHLKPGYSYLFPSGRKTAYRCATGFSLDWLHFNVSSYNQLQLFDALKCPIELPTIESPLSDLLFKQLHQYGVNGTLENHLASPAIMQLLLSGFIAKGELYRDEEINRLRPVLNYIDDNIGSNLKLPLLAKLVFLEVNYFSQLFLKSVGVPPSQYIQQRRIEVATKLLTNNKSIDSIAQELGYFDSSHFCRFFKKITGLTPNQYRRQSINSI